MNKTLKIIATIAMGAVLSMGLFACSDAETPPISNGDNNIQNVMPDRFQLQIDTAKSVLNSFYAVSDRTGGLFAPQAVNVNALNASTADEKDKDDSTITLSVGLDTVRTMISGYPMTGESNRQLFSEYVSEIFVNTQTLLSVIKEYGKQALCTEYAVDYGKTDLDKNNTSQSDAIADILPSATMLCGADTALGRVYSEQKYTGTSVGVTTEYFFNSESDLGVTTLRRDPNNSFEYEFCDIGNNTVIRVTGEYSDGDVTLISYNIYRERGEVSLSADQKDKLFDFVEDEIERIVFMLGEFKESNAEVSDASTARSCGVKLEFDMLKLMLGE